LSCGRQVRILHADVIPLQPSRRCCCWHGRMGLTLCCSWGTCSKRISQAGRCCTCWIDMGAGGGGVALAVGRASCPTMPPPTLLCSCSPLSQDWGGGHSPMQAYRRVGGQAVEILMACGMGCDHDSYHSACSTATAALRVSCGQVVK
jgi:hypothetical protein